MLLKALYKTIQVVLLTCILLSVAAPGTFAFNPRKRVLKKITVKHSRIISRTNKKLLQDDPSKQSVKEYEERIRQMISSVEFAFNVLGDDNAEQSDKTAIITNSYLKFFRDGKVQVEDDLDETRKISIKKNIQAYLQDIDYFYKSAKFSLDIDNISYFNDNDKSYFKVTVSRNLSGTNYNGESINNIKKRYFEINLDSKKQDLKIASIYSENDTNQTDENRYWWRNLPVEWVNVFTSLGNIPANASDAQLTALLNTEEININGNKTITNLAPLYKFTRLKRIDAGFTRIDNLDPLRSLIQLEELSIDSTGTSSINGLKYISGLKKLSIANTKITDLQLLNQFSSLKTLNVEGLNLNNNFAFLQGLKQLESLNIAHTKLSNDSILNGLNLLKELNISRNPLVKISAIAALSDLSILNIDSTAVTDLKPLSKLKNLDNLSLNGLVIANLDDLESAARLTVVYADNTKLSTEAARSFINTHPKARLIYKSEVLANWWADLDKSWKDIFRKQADFKGIPGNEELSKVDGITILDVSNDSTISDLKALPQLANLKALKCNNTRVNSLEPISKNLLLESVEFNTTAVSSIVPLQNLPKLKYVDCNNTEIDSAQAARFITGHPGCVVLYKSNKLKTWWSALNNNWKQALSASQKWISAGNPTEIELHELANTESIVIDGYPNLNSLSPLLMLNNLKSLVIVSSQLTDISLVKRFKNLRNLQLTQCPLKNIAPIAELSNLVSLNLHATAIEELTGIEKLTKLEQLNCSGTPVDNLKPLADLANLKQLDCSATHISSLRHLKDIKNLQSLTCYNTKLWKSDIASFKKAHPACNVVFY